MKPYSIKASFLEKQVKPVYGVYQSGQRVLETPIVPKGLYVDIGETEPRYSQTTADMSGRGSGPFRPVSSKIIDIVTNRRRLNELVTVKPAFTKEVASRSVEHIDVELVRTRRGLSRSAGFLITNTVVQQETVQFHPATHDGSRLYAMTYEAWELSIGPEVGDNPVNNAHGIYDAIGRPARLIVQEILAEDEALERVAVIREDPNVARLFALTVAQEFLTIPVETSLQNIGFENNGLGLDLMALQVAGAVNINEVIAL